MCYEVCFCLRTVSGFLPYLPIMFYTQNGRQLRKNPQDIALVSMCAAREPPEHWGGWWHAVQVNKYNPDSDAEHSVWAEW
jgi:hypothetical protein